MKLSSKSKEYMIPEYSLTGDLLSFLTCNLQYRYQNKGELIPSRPIQLWFGEFIHGVMEEAYTQWKLTKKPFPWDWLKDIRPIEAKIDERMQARGLYPPALKYFIPYQIPDENLNIDPKNPPKRIVSSRTENSINIWGKEIFPLIDSAEVMIKSLREMPKTEDDENRAEYYCINGIIDVLSSLNINDEIEKDNLIFKYLKKNEHFRKYLESLKEKESSKKNKNGNSFKNEEYEIIIDYKGMKRPTYKSNSWEQQAWQILTYSWLRKIQNDAKPIVVGIIFYLNELLPAVGDLIAIKKDIENNETDIEINDEDWENLEKWKGSDEEEFPQLSEQFKIDRSIRIIEINNELIDNALNQFDHVVSNIEKSTIAESKGVPIKNAWKADSDNERTCDACDFKSFCKKYKSKTDITVP
ncbi:PD-(D/E)XK nuclease family protein [Methanobrevibacter filiformis]|uniref:PD-(D/E)XK nuclease superfamily protein n=1 Tax=Methanobrevibacter filiformis TaxID=55758 RepID=A0A166C7F2_9EURY|nr:PD-(D/E)XK nuclease family protein [Methanobrevibacter filiformis]KZX11907.1 PD-(D/E)XK nuclease superfamily protein [Methanobrevibacter filiformis]